MSFSQRIWGPDIARTRKFGTQHQAQQVRLGLSRRSKHLTNECSTCTSAITSSLLLLTYVDVFPPLSRPSEPHRSTSARCRDKCAHRHWLLRETTMNYTAVSDVEAPPMDGLSQPLPPPSASPLTAEVFEVLPEAKGRPRCPGESGRASTPATDRKKFAGRTRRVTLDHTGTFTTYCTRMHRLGRSACLERILPSVL